ncbi:unnamed protein product [Anisakis simplex]|uniref:7TM_GPCR_Srx domain-containing protein n=1 Tax=Anisakis simplex TaxID=6269 RepID=A0A0M3J4T1_ANISI|nr:unnamed protein product [Anisakis simplex]VDK19940.1 unnamed protein product [Anisakis simplex]
MPVDPSDLTDDIIAAGAIFVVAIIGIVTNGMSAATIFKMDHLRNAFGYSCASHAVGNLGVLLIYAIWAAPILIVYGR